MRADAIDLSHWDDVQDRFAGTKEMGILGVINKVTEGLGYVDPSYNWRRGPATRAGLKYGAYHFIRPANAITQANRFLDNCGDLNGLLLALDYEDPDVSVSTARAFIMQIKRRTGYWPVLYSFQSFLLERASQLNDDVFRNCPLWLAAYNSQPRWPQNIWPNYFLWQFTGDGNGPPPHDVPGIKIAGGCDINVAHDRGAMVRDWATIKGTAPQPEPEPLPPTPDPIDPSPILRIAANSQIARYPWAGRGVAPLGYTKGMAISFVRCLKKLHEGDEAAKLMASANSHLMNTDVLSWYAGVFNAKGMNNDSSGPDTLRHLFALMMGLGMRESSGIFTEGRDMSADNTTSDTAEAGLFQQSWNSHTASSLIAKLADQYTAQSVDGFADIFREGVTKPMTPNFGSGLGRQFQALCKLKPAFAVEAAAVGLRVIRKHWGPLNRYEVELATRADMMLKDVQVASGIAVSEEPVA